jgi:hypothetical protein
MTSGAATAAIVADDSDDSDGAPMTAEIARVATAQVTTGSVIELLANVEGAALVLRNLGLVVDPIRLVLWLLREVITGAAPWDPAHGTFGAHLRLRAWARLTARAEEIAIGRAMATGRGLDELHLSTAQVGTWVGTLDAARRLGELMPFVRAHDMSYVPIAARVRDSMRRQLARVVAAPSDGTVARAITDEATGPLEPGCDGVTDAPHDADGGRS